MKRVFALILASCMLLALAACGSSNANAEATTPPTAETAPQLPTTSLGDTGVQITLPEEMGFEAQTSELNDYFAVSANSDCAIVVNIANKSDYTGLSLAEYADGSAEVNGAEGAAQDADGNYYFTYINEDGYHFYTAVREGADKYYRVGFYCFSDGWASFSEQFAQWAATIVVE